MVGGDGDMATMGGCHGWVLWMVVVVVEEEGLLFVDAMGHRMY